MAELGTRAVRSVAGALALVLAAGCSAAGDPPSAPIAVPPAPAPTATAAPALAPLTGLPADGAARAALLVKIDNVDAARPQRGLAAADVVIEELVEGGLTRLVAVISSADPGEIGPVRSVRGSDLVLAGLFERPALVYSGGAGPVVDLVRAAGRERRLVSVSPDDHPDLFRRRTGKASPHNLYATASALWGDATEAQPPAPLFAFGLPAESRPAATVDVVFPSNRVAYRWDPASGTWLRAQNGRDQVDEATGATIGFTNVVVLDTRYVPASTDARSPEVDLGTGGAAAVYRNGTVADCTWSLGPVGQPRISLRSSSGGTCSLAPGRTVVELRPR